MLSNPMKLKFHRRKYLLQSCDKDNKTIEKIKKSPTIYKEEFLIDRNLSIMTNKHFESDVVDNVYPQQKQHVDAKTSYSSSTSLQDSYVMIASEEMPIVLNDTNWEYVDYHDITESIRTNSTVKKYCSPKCSSAWFLKIRCKILKNCRNKIYPVLTNRTNG